MYVLGVCIITYIARLRFSRRRDEASLFVPSTVDSEGAQTRTKREFLRAKMDSSRIKGVHRDAHVILSRAHVAAFLLVVPRGASLEQMEPVLGAVVLRRRQ